MWSQEYGWDGSWEEGVWLSHEGRWGATGIRAEESNLTYVSTGLLWLLCGQNRLQGVKGDGKKINSVAQH